MLFRLNVRESLLVAGPRRGMAAVCLIGALSLWGCGEEQSQGNQQSAPPPSVVVQSVSLRDVLSEQTFTGRIEAIDKVQIRARVQGFLTKRLFEEGAEVKRDETLFEIDREPFEIAVAQAEANLASAQAARKLAQQTYDRTVELVSRNTASQASLDSALSTLAQAEATVSAQDAALKTAKLNLSYTRIVAPIDGRVGRAAYSVGNLVGPDSGTLVTLVAQDPMYVTFPVPQELLLEVRKAGMQAENFYAQLTLADGSNYDQLGEIRFADVQSTASTDSVIVRAAVRNPDRLLVDQELVNVAVVRKQPEQRLVMSQSALLLDQQGAYALVVKDDNKVAIQRITVGRQVGPAIVVESGLAEGDKVIVSGHQKARPGEPVTPQTEQPDATLATHQLPK